MTRRVELTFVLFLVSGFGGLIYESVWTHYLKLFLGHSAYAQTVVLVVFIGGLAIGAWTCARLSQRIRNPLRWYAGVELAVGLVALAFHPIFMAATDWGYATLLPAACSPAQPFCAAQWALSALLLLPQSILIGATFPLVSSAVLRMDPSMPGHHIALLYFLNSLGAVFGVLASIFLLIPAFGLPGTLAFAGAANIGLAIAAFLLARETPAPLAIERMDAAEAGRTGEEGDRLLPILLATAFLTGLSSFIYEIVWIRMLSLVLGGSTYSFELMLASFILGLALGGLWVRRRIDSVPDPVRYLGLVQIVMGVAAAATLVVYNASFDLMAWLLSAVARNSGGFVFFNVASTAIALLVMLPATFCAGMTLPLITYRLLRSNSGERALGLVYSVNTVGAIVGVILAVHVLMVTLGLRGALLVGAAVDVALGAWLLASRRKGPWLGRAMWPAIAGVALLAFVGAAFDIDLQRSSSGVFRTGAARIAPGSQVTFHRDGKTATIDVLDDGHVRAIRTNGKTDASINMDLARDPTGDELTMALLSILPLAHQPQARTAAIIGFGSGMSTEVMLGAPRLERVDTVEIEPAMVKGAEHFRPLVQRAFDDPRSRIVIDDAKSYFARGRERYDIIVSEPSNPWVSGVSSLFTEEFYARLSQSLNEGGVLSQWLHTYEMDPESLASIFAAVAKTFPDFVLYSSIDSDVILIARKGGGVGKIDPQVLEWPSMRHVVQRLKITDADVLRRRGLGNAASLEALYRRLRVPANSDFFPIVDHRASRTRFTQERVTELAALEASAVPMLEMLDGTFVPSAKPSSARLWAVADRASHDAWRLHDVIVAGAGSPEPVPAQSLEHPARLLSMWARDCKGAPSFDELLPSMVTLAEVVNPQLPPQAAGAVWARVAASPCAARLSEPERNSLALFAAVGRRDAAGMIQFGARMLQATSGTRTGLSQYAYLATVTGLACQGRMAEAKQIMAQGNHDWLVTDSRPVEVAFLQAIVNDPDRAGKPHPACK